MSIIVYVSQGVLPKTLTWGGIVCRSVFQIVRRSAPATPPAGYDASRTQLSLTRAESMSNSPMKKGMSTRS